jgi:hypothetical protein
MKTKSISSTDAQNNFGRVIESTIQEHTAYFVMRRNVAHVVIIGIADLRSLLQESSNREKLANVIREVSAEYELGEDLGGGDV